MKSIDSLGSQLKYLYRHAPASRESEAQNFQIE
jgi:hypothetical protein